MVLAILQARNLATGLLEGANGAGRAGAHDDA